MKVIILNSVTSDTTSYHRGAKVDLSTAAAQRLIDAGHALRLVEFADLVENIETAIEAAGYTTATVEPGDILPSGSTISPSGSYWWDADDRINLIHPSGAHAVLEVFHLTPTARP